MNITVKGFQCEVIVAPTESVYDAFQLATSRDRDGFEKGRGDFDVDGLRIFAEDLRTAKRIASMIRKGE